MTMTGRKETGGRLATSAPIAGPAAGRDETSGVAGGATAAITSVRLSNFRPGMLATSSLTGALTRSTTRRWFGVLELGAITKACLILALLRKVTVTAGGTLPGVAT